MNNQELSLKEQVYNTVQIEGKVSISILELQYPHEDRRALYRALDKLERATRIVRVRQHFNNLKSVWMSHEYANLHTEHGKKVMHEVVTELFEHQELITNILTGGDQVEYRKLAIGPLPRAVGHAVLHNNNHHREIAKTSLEKTIAQLMSTLKLARALRSGLEIGGFPLPPFMAAYYQETLQDLTPQEMPNYQSHDDPGMEHNITHSGPNTDL